MKKKREKLAGVELGVDVNSEVNSRSTSAEFSQFYNFWKKWKKWKKWAGAHLGVDVPSD